MIPLKFSFESDIYHFSLLEYGRTYRRLWIRVSSSDHQQDQYLYMQMALYLPWTTGWICPQPYIASRDELWQFSQQHPFLIKCIFEPIEKLRNDPEFTFLADDPDITNLYKLFVFPCEDEPVYIVAAHLHLHDKRPE
jgi:hypothetical protein